MERPRGSLGSDRWRRRLCGVGSSAASAGFRDWGALRGTPREFGHVEKGCTGSLMACWATDHPKWVQLRG